MMRFSTRILGTFAIGATLAACGPSPAPLDDDLARDLQRVGGNGFELAPAGQGTQVMSELEQHRRAPAAAPAPSPTRAHTASNTSRPRQPDVKTAAPAPRAVERTPAPAEVADTPEPSDAPAAVLPRPTSAPQGAGTPPPGGWRRIEDVIRKSRVPINP